MVEFLQTHESRFERPGHGEAKLIHNRAGYATAEHYLIFTGVFSKEVCKGQRVDAVTNALISRGALTPDNEGKRQTRHTIAGKRQRFYAVSVSILEVDVNAR